MKRITAKAALLFGTLVTLLSLPVWAAPAMVWSQDDEPHLNVYYSPDGKRIVQITSGGRNIAPNVFRAQSAVWLTWVDKSDHADNHLKFAEISANGNILEIGSVPTANRSIYAPAISLESGGRRVWLVWTEYNGRTGNLYASYRDVGHKSMTDWKQAKQITPDSAYSASVPIIEASTFDQVQVSWIRTSPTSSEIASMTIRADDRSGSKIALGSNRIPASRQGPITLRHLKDHRTPDIFAKKLQKGQPRSPDEQQWESIAQGKKMLMGAIHSGDGPSRRLAKDAK